MRSEYNIGLCGQDDNNGEDTKTFTVLIAVPQFIEPLLYYRSFFLMYL